MPIQLQAAGAERDSWLALKELHELAPSGWCLTSGALVRLHLADSSSKVIAQRTTEDIAHIPPPARHRPTNGKIRGLNHYK